MRDNWDDLRFVLAVAQAGSISGAARALGVNHATVLRRIAAFEACHGVEVFDRTGTAYVLPPDRARLIEAAREAEAAHLAVRRVMAGARAPLTGAVRVTSTDTLCLTVLPGILSRIRAGAPGLRIDLLCQNTHSDLSRIEADIAIRPALALPDDLRGEVAAELGFAVYAPADDPGCTGWLGLAGPLGRAAVAAGVLRAAEGQTVGAGDSFPVLREMVAAGQGRAVLPCVLGDGDSRVVRLDGVEPVGSVPVWVACHVDLADAPRLGQVRARLVAGLRARAALLRGG